MFDIKKIDSEEFLQILDHREQYQIVDVNEEQDNLSYRMNIHHIPFSELEEHMKSLNKHEPVVLICKFGERSFFGASILQNDHGFKNVISLTGGTKMLSEFMDKNENVKSKYVK